MRCPTLADLPPPPPGRSGWPWTEETPRSPDEASKSWPSITVVVPSYQQASFLEETLRSILLQGYPSLELIVMDGGSTDGTVELIGRYAPWIAAWESAKDGGQSEAINKGWRRATGDCLTWLNSDDLLLPGWAHAAARVMGDDPAVDLVYCDVEVIDKDSKPQQLLSAAGELSVEQIAVFWKMPFAQQGFLMRRRLLESCGYLDESLHFTMDLEYWLRIISAGGTLRYVPRALGAFRVHGEAKTSRMHDVHVSDMIGVVERFCDNAPPRFSSVAAHARRRLYWSAAHAKYDGRRHADARTFALRHLRDDGWRAAPRVAGMVTLSFLGDSGHRLLALGRRLKASINRAGA